jgi:hypothetical protein
MHEMHPMQHVVKQMMEERQRQAARDSLAARHSRTGMLRRFLQAVTRREVR